MPAEKGHHYVTRMARADHVLRDPFDGTEVLMGTVVFDDDRAVATGLLSAAGLPLYRVRETVPMGFRGDRRAAKAQKPK